MRIPVLPVVLFLALAPAAAAQSASARMSVEVTVVEGTSAAVRAGQVRRSATGYQFDARIGVAGKARPVLSVRRIPAAARPAPPASRTESAPSATAPAAPPPSERMLAVEGQVSRLPEPGESVEIVMALVN